MIDLIKLGSKTYCIKNPINVGIYLLDDCNVCVIDTGNSKQFGKLIDKVLEENKWNLKYIINTHSHADHIGGNNYLQQKYNCKIYANKMERFFIEEPILEPAMIYGASPLNELFNPIIFSEKSECDDINVFLEEGLNILNLEGHSFGMIGVVTSDDICFVGDAYTSNKILSKYSLQYVFDVDKNLKTLNYLKTTNYKAYVPSHGDIEYNPLETIETNIRIMLKNLEKLYLLIKDEISYSELLKRVFEDYHIGINIIQYHLIGSTIKAYLTKLVNDEKIEIYFSENVMMIKRK